MWSEIFFQNVREAAQNLLYFGRTRYSINQIEHTLLSELKSDDYEPYLTGFNNQTEVEYPKVEIETCPSLRKVTMLKNNAVTYQPNKQKIQVCRNYIHSLQLLKEEFRRENTIAFDHLILKKPIDQDVHALAQSLIRGCKAEMETAIDYSTGGRKSQTMPKVQQAAIIKSANVHLKHRASEFLNEKVADELVNSVDWHKSARSIVERDSQEALLSKLPFQRVDHSKPYQLIEQTMLLGRNRMTD